MRPSPTIHLFATLAIRGMALLGIHSIHAQEAGRISVIEVNRILRTPAEATSHPVIFRGVVTHWAENPRGAYVQADNSGVFVRLARQFSLPALGDELEIEAHASFTNAGPDTEIDAIAVRTLGHPGLPLLTRCTLADATSGKVNRLAVETEAVVLNTSTHFGVPWLMLSDASGVAMAGIHSSPPDWKPSALIGQRIRLRGVSAGVWHMPLRCSSPDEITVLGPDTGDNALPMLTTADAVNTLAITDGKARPVRLRGTCTYVNPTRKYCYLYDGKDEALVNLPRFDPGGKVPHVGENAIVSGVVSAIGAGPQINAWSVETLGPAKEEAPVHRGNQIDGPPKTIAEIKASPPSVERMNTTGVVIYVARSGAFTVLTVQDDTGTAYFYGPTEPPYQVLPQPGDRVEIAGEHRTTFQFYEAAWRIVGHVQLPPAPSVAMAAAMNLAYDGKRARIRGRVVDYQTFVERGMNISRIWVRDGDVVTYGNYLGPNFAPAPAKIGQLVELNGICNVGLIAPNVVRSYFVQLNRMSDVRPLPEPWQNPAEHPIVNAIAAGLVGASVWVMVLRHQVRTRTELLAESESELRHALAREQELSKLKTAFISMVSHEFRTPLNIIVTSADILSRYLDRLRPEERKEHLSSIQQSGKRMAGMMEDVLLLGRLESQRQKLNPQEIHLAAWCRRFIDEMVSATGGRCPIELRLGKFEPLAQADENILRHILANLISNAVKYSGPGAQVIVSVERDGKHAIFRIEDRGIGIPAADRARLFEAFQRGSNVGQTNGTGLGLVVVKRGVELHGGRLEFTSDEGKGTVFTVRLPLFDEST